MLTYPTISKDIVQIPIYAFDKLDGLQVDITYTMFSGFCPNCSQDFTSKSPQKTCSWDCRLALKEKERIEVPCARCGKGVIRTLSQIEKKISLNSQIFCSKVCFYNKRRTMAGRMAECEFCHKDYPYTTDCRRFCSLDCRRDSAYEHRVTTGVTITTKCGYCSKPIIRARSQIEKFSSVYCSREHKRLASEKSFTNRSCLACKRHFRVRTNEKTKTCCPRHGAWTRKPELLPMRLAWEIGVEQFINAVRDNCSINAKECWIPKWTNKPYTDLPLPGIKSRPLHRTILLFTKGDPSDKFQQSHHTCANAYCVNPEHLQWLDPHHNLAEMKERGRYILRIKRLEEALAALEPNHKLLG